MDARKSRLVMSGRPVERRGAAARWFLPVWAFITALFVLQGQSVLSAQSDAVIIRTANSVGEEYVRLKVTTSTTGAGVPGTANAAFQNSYVGIGTTTPGAPLDVKGTANIGISYQNTGGGHGRIQVGDTTKSWSFSSGFNSAGNFALVEEGVTGNWFTVEQGSGAVGLNTSSPWKRLSINASSTAADGIGIDGTSNPGVNFRESGADCGALGVVSSAGGWVAGSTRGDLVLRVDQTVGNQDIHFSTNAGTSRALTIEVDGDLDMAVDGAKLRLPRKGTTGDPAGGLEGMLYYNDADNTFRIYEGAAWKTLDAKGSGDCGWIDDGATVRLATAGDNVGIGTTSPGAKLDVSGGIQLQAGNALQWSGGGTNTINFNQGGSTISETASGNLTLSTDDNIDFARAGTDWLQFQSGAGSDGGTIQFVTNAGVGTRTIDFGRGNSSIREDSQLRIRTDDNIYLESNTGGTLSGSIYLKASNATLDGTLTMDGHIVKSWNSADVAAGNWYRIASNPGNRADATFVLRDLISGGGHSTVRFHAGVNYGDANGISFTMLSHSEYVNTTFTQARIIEATTYDGAYLEVYCNRSGTVEYAIWDNEQNAGWVPVDWTAGSIPGGWIAHTYEIDQAFMVGGSDDFLTVARSGNVGVANSAPAYPLDVAGNAQITSTLRCSNVTTDSGNLILSGGGWGMELYIDTDNNSANNYAFYGNGSEIMRILDTGMVGIGTTNPTHYLEVVGNVAADDSVVRVINTNPVSSGSDPWALYAACDNAAMMGVGVYGLGGYSGVEGHATRNGNWKRGVYGRAASTDLVGSNWGVRGSAYQGATAYGVYGEASGATTNWAGYFGSGNVYVQNTLDVDGTCAADYFRADAQDGTNEGGEIQMKGAGSWADWQIDLYADRWRLHTGAICRFQVYTDGRCDLRGMNDTKFLYRREIAGSNYMEWDSSAEGGYVGINYWNSSRKMKKNITPLAVDTSRIFDLELKSYNYKTDPEGHRKDVGMIAEDVAEIFPEIVAFDSEDKPHHIKYGLLAVLNLDQMKKMRTEVDELKQTVNELRYMVQELKAQLDAATATR